MGTGRRVAVAVLSLLAAILFLLVVALALLSTTDWGREKARVVALEQLRGAINGDMHIGRVEGNLLDEIRLIDVTIVDSAGRPFVSVDTLSTGYSLGGLLSKRIRLSDMRLVNASVVLDRLPGEEWNFVNIFSSDDEAESRPSTWGEWVELRDFSLVNSQLTLSTEWTPPPDLNAAEREEAIRRALAGETRDRIVVVPGGFQNVMDFRELNADFARILIAHPDSAAIPIEVERLSGIAELFNTPAADVRDLAGRFRMEGDTLHFSDIEARLPDSYVRGEGFYAMGHGDLKLEMDGMPIALNDMRWLYPRLPKKGGGTLEVDFRMRPSLREIEAREVDLRIGQSELRGKIEIAMGDSIRLRDTNLAFARLDTRLIETLAPAVSVPYHGLLDGHIILDGVPEAMHVDGDVTFTASAGRVSRILATGEVGMGERVRFNGIDVRMQPLQTDLVRAAGPDLPLNGTIEGRAQLTGTFGERLHIESDLLLRDPDAGVSRLAARGGVVFGDAMRLADVRMQFDPLQLDVVRGFAPSLPAGATVSGPLRVDGPLAGVLQIDGDLVISDPASGLSHVEAHGGIEIQGETRFSDLELRFDPIQMALLRAAAPSLALGGTLTGSARVDGSPSERLALDADVGHVEGDERSHVTASGVIGFAPGSEVDLNLQFAPVSLQTVGQFAPEAGLHGSAEGDVTVQGSLGDLRLAGDIRFSDGGLLDIDGRLDLASTETSYDVNAVLSAFDPSSVSTRSPVTTTISGDLRVEGQGFDPATMRATVAADLNEVGIEGYEADEIHLRLSVEEGLATVSPLRVSLQAAEAEMTGSFGLVASRAGRLDYSVRVDSLHTLAPWIPQADTGVVVPRPAVERAARQAAIEAEKDREVAYLATGTLPDLPPQSGALVTTTLSRDSLAGSLAAEGSLVGNIERFDVEGRAVLDQIIYQGHFVEHGEAAYALEGVGTDGLEGSVDASFGTMLVSGYALDSAAIDLTYTGGTEGAGEAAITVVKDEDTDLRVDAEIAMSLRRNEIRVRELDLRLDTVRWTSTERAVVSWGEEGVDVENLDLRSDAGGRVYIDGTVPLEGPADLEVTVTDLELAQIAELLQDDRSATGRLTAEMRLQGTAERPTVSGSASLMDATIDGEWVPEIRADFRQNGEQLDAELDLLREGSRMAEARVRLPLTLSPAGEGPRLLEQPMEIEIRGGHIPLEVLPAFTDQVEAVDGGIGADLVIRGTPQRPVIEGDVTIALESLVLVPLGVRFGPIRGHATAAEGVLEIDSLVAWSEGPTRISGRVGMESLTDPELDLRVDSRNAWVIDTEDARLQVDADLAVEGPINSLAVTGLVRTRRGVIYVPELSELGGADIVQLDDPGLLESADTLLRAQRDIVTEESEIARNLDVEVEVEIDRDVWLRSTEANVEIYTPTDVGPLRVRMSGTQDQPSIEGTINTDRGEYEYLSRRFTLTRGAVTFLESDELDPLLQVAAEHDVQLPGREPVTIRIVISGTVRDLKVTLESNAQPPISQSDLLSFLAFGREASTLMQSHGSSITGQGSGGGGLVGNLAGVATQQFTAIALESMLSGVEADVGRELGLDVIRITPANSSFDIFTGSYLDVLRGTEVEAGRYVNSRLFVAAQARPTTYPGILLEYRTRRDFEWSASWRSRYIPTVPTLREPEPDAVGVFGSFLFKEWRF